MAHPSLVQTERLVQFLEDNPGIAKGYLRSSQARHETKMKWEQLAAELNSLGGATKDARSWTKVWTDKKYALKKYLSKRNASARCTDGGAYNLPPLSDLEEKMVSILGGFGFAVGNEEISVPLGVSIESEDTQLVTQEVLVILDSPIISDKIIAQMETQRQESVPHPSTPRRSPRRLRRRRVQPHQSQSQLNMERERLIKIEEKRVEAELASAAGWANAVKAINNLATAITMAGDKIAEALQSRQ